MSFNASAADPGVSAPWAVISDTDLGGLIGVSTAMFLSFVLVALPIRVYVRRVTTGFKMDDYFFLAAVIFSCIQSSIVFAQLHDGYGKMGALIDPDERIAIEKSAYASDILYLFTLLFSKCSTAILYLRITPGRGHALAAWATIAASVVWAVVSVFLVAFRCGSSPPWALGGTVCPGLLVRWQVIGALDITTEVTLFLISIYLIWALQVPVASKVIIVTAFGFRLLVVFAVATRLHYLDLAASSENPTYDGAYVVVCTQLETGYAILASLVPCLKPFMMAYEGPERLKQPAGGYGANYRLSNLHPSEGGKSPAGTTKDIPDTLVTANLRGDRPVYVASISHPDNNDQRSVGSDDSQRMIIKKETIWAVDRGGDAPKTIEIDAKQD